MEFCEICLRNISSTGFAGKIYELICETYFSTGSAANLSSDYDVILKFLEMRGYIITHKPHDHLTFAKPYICKTGFCRKNCERECRE